MMDTATEAVKNDDEKEEIDVVKIENLDSTPQTPSKQQQPPVLNCRACGRGVVNKPEESPTASTPRYIGPEHSVVLCEACKKFHSRYRTKIQEETCTCGGNVILSSPAMGEKCRVCRFNRCENAVKERRALAALPKPRPPTPEPPPPKPAVEKINFSIVPCAICGCSSSGFHFGVVSCEGCKGFFRRSMNKTFKIEYKCKALSDVTSPSSPSALPSSRQLCLASSNCRKCRLQRCIDAGMSMNEISIGRHTIQRRQEIEAAIKRHLSEGSVLSSKLCRRFKRSSENVNGGDNDEDHDEDFDTPSSSLQTPTKEERLFSSRASSSLPPHSLPAQQAPMSVTQPRSSSSLADCSFTAYHVNTPTNSTTAKTTCSNVEKSWDFEAFDRVLNESSEWFTDKAVEAAARLSKISRVVSRLTWSMTSHEITLERVRVVEEYVKSISEFTTVLPGITRLPLSDRILLFTQALYPISVSQLSLHFDVDRQIPNLFSFARDDDTCIIARRDLPEIHDPMEQYFIQVGNMMSSTIGSLKEFSLFVAQLLLNSETPGLSCQEQVAALRRRYDLALFFQLSRLPSEEMEQRLTRHYALMTLVREVTSMFHNLFESIKERRPQDMEAWTPLFNQIVGNLLTPASSVNPSPADSHQSPGSYSMV